MTKDFSNALSNICCIDLLNTSWEEINNYCLISNVANGLKMYFKHLHSSLHTDLFNPYNPHKVFFDSDYFIGSIRNEQSVEQFSLGGPEILPDVNAIKMDLSLFENIEKEIYITKNIDLTDDLGYELFHKMKPILLKNYNTDFVQIHVDISNELAIPYSEFCKEYNQNIVFLNCENQPDLHSLRLHRIFYRYKQAIIFTFKNEIGLEYMSWNKEFLTKLRNCEPIHFVKINTKTKLNAVLDKLGLYGITGLDEDELAFLKTFSE